MGRLSFLVLAVCAAPNVARVFPDPASLVTVKSCPSIGPCDFVLARKGPYGPVKVICLSPDEEHMAVERGDRLAQQTKENTDGE